MTDWKNVPDDEWREKLTPLQFEVTRRAGTERPGTGEYNKHDEEGVYSCVCCGTELFTSTMKFDSGCGWPSFYEELDNANIERREDTAHGMRRVEILCSECGAHLGHVFPDGPKPTGERYCVNSASLDFEPGDSNGPEVGSQINLDD